MEASAAESDAKPGGQAPLVLVSNRGPVTFDVDGSFHRGTGGLVTALTGLATHRDAVWIASAMTEGDVCRSRERNGRAFVVDTPAGEFHVRLVVSDPEAYDRFYNVVANPMLWFIQHYLWDLANAPDIRENEVHAFDEGYKAVNDDLEEAVAAYKQYDVMIVNAMFDGMNLVAKEGAVVNERNGVSILSENTGAHEELGEWALSVNPFDIKETADSIHRALTMTPEERERRCSGLKGAVTARDPGDWIDEQLADIREKNMAMAQDRPV